MRIAVLAAAVALVCAQQALAESIERRAAADLRGEVEIVNVAGSVEVRGWDRAEVQVNADLGSGVERLDFVRNKERTIIKVVLPSGRRSSANTELVVRIPQQSSLSINTVSAEQTIRDVHGPQRLQAVSGNIETEVWSEIEAKTVSGEINAKGRSGAGGARVTSVSGNVQLDNTGPELDLNTVSGEMNVQLKELQRARIRTTNGDLELVATLVPDGRIDAEAVNGDINVYLRGKLNAEFDIETFNGEIDNCFGKKPQRTREYGPGNELRFKEGSGSARVRIKTLNGGVEVCRK